MIHAQSYSHPSQSLEERIAHIKGQTHLSKDERNRKIDQAYADDARRKLGVLAEFSAENLKPSSKK